VLVDDPGPLVLAVLPVQLVADALLPDPPVPDALLDPPLPDVPEQVLTARPIR
jgi:hypothetical protein